MKQIIVVVTPLSPKKTNKKQNKKTPKKMLMYYITYKIGQF
jgi:hypothetical protein